MGRTVDEGSASRRMLALLEAARDPMTELAEMRCECAGADADCVITDMTRAAATFIATVVRALEGPPAPNERNRDHE